MNIGVLFFIYYVQWSIGNILYVNSSIKKDDYLKYLKKIVDHIRIQDGWNSIRHLEIYNHENKIMTVGDMLAQDVGKNDIIRMFDVIVNLLNYKYTNIIKTFVEYISIILGEYNMYYRRQLSKEFIYCARSLEIEVKNSLPMFEHMYKAVTIIGYSELKNVIDTISSNSYNLIETIYFIKTYVKNIILSMELDYFDHSDSAIVDIAKFSVSNITEFIKIVSQSIAPQSNALIKEPERVNLSLDCLHEFENNEQCHSNLTSFMCYKLDLFYDSTIINEYQNMGFTAFSFSNSEKK